MSDTSITMTDEDAKQRVLQDFWPTIGRIAASYEANLAMRQELEQEMAVEIWRSLDRYANKAQLQTYLYRIAHNVGVKHVKTQFKQPSNVAGAETTTSVGPLEEVEVNQDMNRLFEAVRQLPLSHRQVLTLVLDGLKHQEIGEILGINKGNVAVRVNRAKERLKQIFNHPASEGDHYGR